MYVSRDLITIELQNSLGREPTEAEIQERVIEVEATAALEAAQTEKETQQAEAEADDKVRAAKDAVIADERLEEVEVDNDLKAQLEKQHDAKVDADTADLKETEAAALDQKAHDVANDAVKKQAIDKVEIEQKQALAKVEEKKEAVVDADDVKKQGELQLSEDAKAVVVAKEADTRLEETKHQIQSDEAVAAKEATVPVTPDVSAAIDVDATTSGGAAPAITEPNNIQHGDQPVGPSTTTIGADDANASPWLAPVDASTSGTYSISGNFSWQDADSDPQWVETVVPRQAVAEIPDLEDNLAFKLADEFEAVVDAEREIFLDHQREKLEPGLGAPSVDHQPDKVCLPPLTADNAEYSVSNLRTNVGIADNREMANKLVGETADLAASTGLGLVIVGAAVLHKFTDREAAADFGSGNDRGVEAVEPLKADELKSVSQAADKAAMEAADRLAGLQEAEAPAAGLEAAGEALGDAATAAEGVRNTYALQSLNDPANFPSLDAKMDEQITPYLDRLAAFDASVDEAIASGTLHENSKLAMHQASREEIAADFATDYRCAGWREVNETADRLGVSTSSSSSAEDSLASVFSSASAEVKDRDLDTSWMHAVQEVTHHAETGVGGPSLGISTY